MKKACSLLLAMAMILSLFPSYAMAEEVADAAPWDLFSADTQTYTEHYKLITSTNSGHAGLYGEAAQCDGYVNVSRDDDQSVNLPTGGGYTWFSTKSAVDFPDEAVFTVEASVRLGGARNGKANEISARVSGKGLYPMFLKYGADGGVALESDYSDLAVVDTTQWHNYGLVIDPAAKTYDVYVDGVLTFENAAAGSLSGADLLRMGADSDARCDMDIQSVRIGTGDLSASLSAYGGEAYPDSGRLVMAQLSQDTQSDAEAAEVTVTVHSQGYTDATEVKLTLLDGALTPVDAVSAAQNLSGSAETAVPLTIPAGIRTGTYYIKAETADSDIFSVPYTVLSGAEPPEFPAFAALGYAIDMADYTYNPTDEFNFPTIVDTRDHPVTNSFGDNAYRYYLYYAPHDAPAGNCVAASNSLDGPWVEYENNPVVSKTWPKDDGSGENWYSVSHVSSPHVVWIEEQGCYVMYFHGENSTTRYATSTDLLTWTYGGVCITASQFSTDSATYSQASYAKVFEHAVPGLDNKYIMLMMVTRNESGGYHSNIGWAHSRDGVNWTAVKTPLVDPNLDADVYKTNLSGPWFMEWEGRYFVICHASSGEMYAFEVGEKLDQCTQWGEVYNSQGVRGTDDANPECYPDYGRSGAPFFIQDDAGRWHMFYEAGKRLNTNTVHAVEVKAGEENDLARGGLELENANLKVGETARPVLHLFDKSNRQVAADTQGLTLTYHVGDPAVLGYEDGALTALAAGTSTAWVTATLNGKTAVSSKVQVTVQDLKGSWDLFSADTTQYTESFKVINSAGGGAVEQKAGYVNITKGDDKSNTASGGAYTWLAPSDGLTPVLPKDGPVTVEAAIRLSGPVEGARTNEFSVRVNGTGKYFPIFLKYGADGGVTNRGDFTDVKPVDTTVWHNYAMVIDPVGKTYRVFVDGVEVLDEVSNWGLTGGDLVRIGVDNKGRSNMDVQSLRVGTGDLSAELGPYDGEDPDQGGSIRSVRLSANTKVEGTAADVDVTVTTANIAPGETILLKLVDDGYQAVAGVSADAAVSGDTAGATLTIPADAAVGGYYVQAEWGGKILRSEKYTVTVDPQDAPGFPTFVSTGYTIEMVDYQYNPTEEFNFPTIVDTKDHPVTNSFGDNAYRYYLYYAPHDAPAGNCVAASNSLDGPWVQYENNPVVAKTWPKEEGSGNYYSVSHVSSPYVMWLAEQNCYIMYFHGENTTTRYATSTDLLNWTYGGVCVTANQFSTTGSGFSEASYAKVFEHTVPGLDNKYIMLLMVTGSGNGMHRNIYWAHSQDGVNWTPVQKSLLNPDMNSAYKDNFSGPWFMEWEGRYFVICHASSGEMYAFEVGEKLDQCIEWGEVYNSQGVRGQDDANPECYPDYGRSGAPFFIQDDAGRWHMYYEAGKRLNTNIVHAVEVRSGEENDLARGGLELEKAALEAGETAQTVLHLFDKSNRQVSADTQGLTLTYHVGDPAVLRFENGVITALAAGTSTAWVTAALDGKTVQSAKEAVTVAEKVVQPQEVIVTNDGLTGKTALNLELPAIFKAQGVLAAPIDNYYLYFSYNDESGGVRSIALATAPAPEGPWTVYDSGKPVLTKEELGLTGTGVNAPWPVWDAANGRMLMYYSQSATMIGVAESTDGLTFTNLKTVLAAADLPQTGNTYQQSVYEYTIPGKDNKYVMFYTGNGYKETGVTTNGKQLFCAWSGDGLAWTAAEQPLLAPQEGLDKGNIASPRLLVKDGAPYVVYHNSTGNLEYAQLSADFSSAARQGTLYDSVEGEPDRARAADAAFLTEGAATYFYYTARSNKAKNAADASVLVCRRLFLDGETLFQDDFGGGDDNWEVTSGTWAVTDGAYVQSSTSGGAMAFAGDPAWGDYEVEFKVTPTATSKNISVMLSGRATDANNRYIGSYNGGKLVIDRRIDNASKILAQTGYTMELNREYTLKMVFFGNQMALYVDGVKELEATDDTYATGKIGLVTYNTSAKFDDVIVRAVTSDPDPAGPIAVEDFGDHQVIQRDPATGTAQVAIKGTASIAAARVEARVVEFESGKSVVDWAGVAAGVAAGAAWSGSITVPQGGWYKVEVRALDENGQVLGSEEGTHKWGVGINILCIGQSNMVGQAPETPRTEASDLVANYTRSGTWTHLADPYDGAGGSLVPAMGNALVEKLGIPVGFIPAADSGSGLHAPNPYTNPPHSPTRYWMYYTTPDDTSTLYGKAVTRAKAAGGVELAVWNQGETDGAISVPKETYESDMKILLSRFRTDLANPDLPIFLCQIGTHNPNISNDADYTAIRSAQHDLDNGKDFFLAATEMEFARKDTAHYRKSGMDEIGRRVANSVLYYYGQSDYYRGPYISGAEYADATGTVIDVKITHRGGTDLTPAEGGIPGFSVLDGLNEVEILSAVRKDAATVRLTLSAPISGSGSIRYLYGLNPYPDTEVPEGSTKSDLQKDAVVVKDNTPLALPLENTTADVSIDAYTEEPAAGYSIQITADKTSVQVGGEVTVTVTAKGGAFVGAACRLSYDSGKFAVTSAPDGWDTAAAGSYSYYNVMNDGGTYPEDTVLGVFTFEAEAQTEEVTGRFDLTDNYIAVQWEDGLSKDDAVKLPDSSVDVKITLVPAYVVEIVNDYVAGYSLVLAYTNSGTGACTYDGAAMYDVTDAGYRYQNTTAYAHVYGLVVKGAADAQKVAAVTGESAGKLTYSTDVNGSGKTDINDAVAVVAAYNGNELYMNALRMAIVLKADVNGDKKVNADDFGLVKAEFRTSIHG